MATIKIKIIMGSTRPNRFSEKPAYWIAGEARKIENAEVELLDLRDYPMPFYDEPLPPGALQGKFSNEVVKKWGAKIREADAFIIIAPEYNHGYPAVLKNAIDYSFDEWRNKPVGFVSYGGVMGSRSVEQLRLVAIEMHMAPIRNAIHIPWETYLLASKEKTSDNFTSFKSLQERAKDFLDQLFWWAEALKTARENQ